MNITGRIQKLLSMILAAVLFFTAAIPAGAEAIQEETLPVLETTEATEYPEMTEPLNTTVPPETTPPPETTLPPETTEPAEITAPSETVPETEPVTEDPEISVLSIAEARALPAGTRDITVRGIVVFAYGTQAVLQDDSGGMRLAFEKLSAVQPGDVLLATGNRTGGFFVTAYEITGTAELPAVETTLLDAPDNLRVRVRCSVLGEKILGQDGFSVSLDREIPEDIRPGDTVEAFGVMMDGYFYADTLNRIEDAPEPVLPEQTWNLYFGQLHAHTSVSDGLGTVEEAYAWAKEEAELDFFAVTDHSNSFDHAMDASISVDAVSVSEDWAAGKAAAQAATEETFAALFGYEMTWGEDTALGHINTFHTPGFQARQQPDMHTLETYYEALTTVHGSVSQFNHPSRSYGDFMSFSHYSPEYDAVIQLLEVGGEDGFTAYGEYTRALDKGWHLAPTNNQTNHEENWGTESDARTVVLAEELTEEALYEAMQAMRVYATEDKDLSIIYKLNGAIMGSIIPQAEVLTITAELQDLSDNAIGTVDVITDEGKIVASVTAEDGESTVSMTVPGEYHYYYLRITQPDGDIAVTAPIWVDSYEDMGIGSFSASAEEPVEGDAVTVTLELFNQERVDFLVDQLTISCGDTDLYTLEEATVVRPLENRSFQVDYTCTQPGEIRLTANVTGTVEGMARSYTMPLTIRCQSKAPQEAVIKQARRGELGESYKITGYVTAGNSKAGNSFPNTLYLQDDTGGIAVTGTFPEGIPAGALMCIVGTLCQKDGNLLLEATKCDLPEGDQKKIEPRTMTHQVAMNYDTHGGELLQIEGEVVSLEKTADGKGIVRFTLKDLLGDLATVIIEDHITSGSSGKNELASVVKKGRTIRVMGLLHREESGTTVLRVRNCEEVTYIEPKKDPTNPKTGDLLFFWK